MPDHFCFGSHSPCVCLPFPFVIIAFAKQCERCVTVQNSITKKVHSHGVAHTMDIVFYFLLSSSSPPPFSFSSFWVTFFFRHLYRCKPGSLWIVCHVHTIAEHTQNRKPSTKHIVNKCLSDIIIVYSRYISLSLSFFLSLTLFLPVCLSLLLLLSVYLFSLVLFCLERHKSLVTIELTVFTQTEFVCVVMCCILCPWNWEIDDVVNCFYCQRPFFSKLEWNDCRSVKKNEIYITSHNNSLSLSLILSLPTSLPPSPIAKLLVDWTVDYYWLEYRRTFMNLPYSKLLTRMQSNTRTQTSDHIYSYTPNDNRNRY